MCLWNFMQSVVGELGSFIHEVTARGGVVTRMMRPRFMKQKIEKKVGHKFKMWN